MPKEDATKMKPNIFKVSRTPKGLDQILTVQPDIVANYHCAVINVSDSPCATFDYQLKVPSFWFPINEIGQWGYSPFFGALRVVNQYYKGDKSVLIHCHAGANRSPSVAYAILRAKGYTEQEASESLKYTDIAALFERNISRKNIPANIVEFLKEADMHPECTIHLILKRLDLFYNEWAQRKQDELDSYTKKDDNGETMKLGYNRDTKRYILEKLEKATYH